MSKRFKSGMYGGKFMPFHKGHLSCLLQALRECEIVHLIMFVGGAQEEEILSHPEYAEDESLHWVNRAVVISRIANRLPRVKFHIVDVSACRLEDGSDDWEKETPAVLACCGKFDAVYGSEESYREYFNKAYPYAEYRVVDADRTKVPISATAIRRMSKEEREEWIVT